MRALRLGFLAASLAAACLALMPDAFAQAVKLDPKKENFGKNKEANALLFREYRKGFEVPETA